MPNTKISALTAPTNAQFLLPLLNSAQAKFAISNVANVSNLGPTVWQLGQNGRVQFWSDVVDLEAAATTTLTVTAGFRFYIEEVSIIATSIAALVAQPIVSFGITGNNTKYVNALQFTQLLATWDRERVALAGNNGETTLNATVDTPANAGTFTGRFCWRGVLLTT